MASSENQSVRPPVFAVRLHTRASSSRGNVAWCTSAEYALGIVVPYHIAVLENDTISWWKGGTERSRAPRPIGGPVLGPVLAPSLTLCDDVEVAAATRGCSGVGAVEDRARRREGRQWHRGVARRPAGTRARPTRRG
jgi:hypothetical protein